MDKIDAIRLPEKEVYVKKEPINQYLQQRVTQGIENCQIGKG
jgi:hypothetical protein